MFLPGYASTVMPLGTGGFSTKYCVRVNFSGFLQFFSNNTSFILMYF
tara:strand:+ start:182 stop:322 length:141 start_codon:yes stop_codon:yes gene_type:complete